MKCQDAPAMFDFHTLQILPEIKQSPGGPHGAEILGEVVWLEPIGKVLLHLILLLLKASNQASVNMVHIYS